FIGTDATGSAFLTGDSEAVRINAGTGTIIGGTTPADRNVMVGKGGINLGSGGAGGSFVEGNYIGVNAAGTAALPSPTGSSSVIIAGSSSSGGNTIGGPAPG